MFISSSFQGSFRKDELERWEARQREKKFADKFKTNGILYSCSF